LTGISSGSVVWGDYDNDGDLDILLTGTADSQASGAISTVYVNNNNSFSEQSTISITGVYNSSVTWIDFDNDNDLDFLITGQDSNDKLVSKVFKNEITVQNVKPEIPANLQATVDSNIVILSWDKATDQQTLQSGLNYNLYIYESGQTTYKRPPLAFRQSDAKNGLRLIESQGNIRWTSDGYQIKNLPPGKTYLWSVQTLDAGLKGSCFSSESSFYVPLYRPAVQAKCLSFSNILATQAKATWANGGGTRRVVFIRAGASGEADPEDNITYNVNDVTPGGWKCVYNGSENFTTITDLVQNTDYYIHVCEYNGDTGSEKYLKTTDYNNPSLLNIIIFTEQTGITLTGVSYSSAAWGNYDNDGDLDILYTGKTVLSEIICRIYRNNGDNTFPDFSTLTGVSYGALAFGDYDNDNDLDIILTGEYKTMINRNDPIGVYTLQPDIVLPAVKYSSTAWGDYDGDGDLDFLLTGETVSNEKISKIYQNNGDLSFNENAASFLVGVSYGSSAWSDYDNDGDLDILLTGLSSSGPVSKIYQNIGDNTFVENDRVKLTGVKNSSVAWGDYDNDGYPDILLTGETETGDKIAKIYRNCGDNTFSVQSINNLSGVSYGSTEWGDFDNDGDLDILLSGTSCYGKITKVFRNLGNNSFYEQISVVLPGTDHGSLAWGDYDNDGDLDILLTGSYGTGSAVLAKVFRNEIPYSNTSPTAPANLQSSLDGEWINFTWNASSDSSTPSSGLLYNLRIGTQTGANNIKSAQSLVTGKLLTPRIINMINGTSFRIKLPVNNYYWSVQAVDRGGLGSSFPGEQTIAADSIQASDLRAFIKTRNSLLVRWENGNGTRRAVFGRLSSSLAPAKPVNGEIYLPEPYFGNGDRIGTSGWYCLYNGKSDSATIYGLNPGYSYDLQVVEYIEIGGLPRYFSTSGQGNPGIFSTSLFSEQTNIVLPDITRSSVAWGDYDNDGDLDILMTGSGITKVYKNDNNNNFIEQSSIVLPDATNGDVTWGDYDNDDDLDILLTGNGVSKIFRNESNAFNPQNDISLLGMSGCTSKWGDYDNDGYLDIMMAGSSGTFPNYIDANKLYHNNGDNTFTEVENNLPPVSSNSLDWGDYDNDGDLDILITGMQGIVPITKIFRNNGGGSFSDEENIILTGVLTGLAEWVDYDNDGDLDIMLTGDDNFMESDSRIISLIYRNNGDNTFTEVSDIIFTGVSLGSFDWGDYDNDGDLDLLLTGDYGALFSYEAISKIYRNDLENGFSELTDISLKAVGLGSVAWGDYDNDGDLDILLTGGPDSGPVTKIYRNNTIMKAGTYVANNKPAAVMNLHSLAQPEGTFLYWAPVCNDETYWKAMSYNIMIGTSANLSDVQSPHSSIINGYRRIADLGNTQSDTSHIVKNLPARKYYWQVQAVDQGFMGGEWSVVDSFEVKNVQAFYQADEVCHGVPTNFTDQSVATDGVASWSWDFKDGTTSNIQNPVHTYSTSGTYNVKLVITDNGGVKDSLEQNVVVRPKPLTGFLAPDVCQGIPLTVTNTTNPNGLTVSSWYWDFGDESVPSYNQQPAPHPYLNPGDYDIKLRAEATNGCADSITKTVSVGAYPVAAVTANASLTFCSGGRVTLSVPYDPEYSYTWQVDGVPLTGGNSYSYVAQLTGDYSVKVVNPKGNCTTISSEVSITSLEAPAAPYISKSGSQTFCEGDSVELSVTNTLNYTYQWKKDGGLVGTGYEYHAKSSGGYSLTVKNTEGCSAEATDTVEVVVRDAPSPGNISVSGPSTFCQGGSVTLSVPATTGYTYKWKNEYGEITGATTSSYAATATGIYKLEVMNSTGCGAETTPVTVTVKATPDKPVITSANYSEGICPGENPITLSASSTVPGYRYMWIRNGELQYTDTLSYIEFYEQGIYKLRAALGDCASESDAFNITLPEAPDKPVMYVKGPVVWYMAASTKSAKYYKWYRDGELIQGANKYIYVANKTLGTYKVAVGNENGCYTMSDPRTIPLAKSEMTDFYIPPEYLNRDGKDPFGSLQIYPNPTAGVFTVEMENSISGEIVISVITEQGKEVRNIRSEKTTEHFITEIDLGDEPKGVYFIMLQIDNYLETRKVVLE
jgi:PKD repeat protein